MPEQGKLVVISGPSGVGKSSILTRVLGRTGAVFSVSVTTRGPRPGEQDGREYRFVDRNEFEDMMENDELLEWAEVFGEYYGTPAAPVRSAIDAGKTVILEIDVQGAMQVHEKMPGATFIMIAPPQMSDLRRRLHKRGSEDEQAAARRLKKAEHELQTAEKSGIYDHWVVNDDLDRATREVVGLVRQEKEPK